ncbi:hypothetical protein LCGC14_0329970 [marine sediment metagenome]|uniref:Uncharacterized protein n=1 Tax=marine sediment metagenome TaxID=412755 RepID=A0A0F9TMD0_9ZZZZ
MNLNYQRCPEDDARVLTASLAISGGQQIDVGLGEIATTLQLKGSIYSATVVIKGGVTDDFIDRVATGLAKQMGEDIHALCPVISILCKAFALMAGGRAVLDKEGLLNVYPSKECPPWMRGLFESIEESKDED